jgi:hypothetical protein
MFAEETDVKLITAINRQQHFALCAQVINLFLAGCTAGPRISLGPIIRKGALASSPRHKLSVIEFGI